MGRIFLLLPVLLLLAGCRKQGPPTLDTLRSQLLRDACDAMLAGDAERSRQALKRLSDTDPDDSFATAVRERIEHHRALLAINQALREGRIADANRSVHEATGPAFKAAVQAGPTVDALMAFSAYLQQRPFASSDQAEAALRALNPQRPILDQSPAFGDFMHQETARLAALRQREAAAVVDLLVTELDLAAVSGAPEALPRLIHLAALNPAHPLIAAWSAALTSNTRELRQLAVDTAEQPAARRAFEIGLCLGWQQLSDPTWRVLAPFLASGQPAGLSGLLLQAAASAEAGDYDEAIRNLHAVAAVTSVERQHVARMLSRYVLSPRQAEAWCWRTPCPGVADVLGCIVQLRTSRSR